MWKRAEGRVRTPILVTMGEPAGIGPEVAAKAWLALGGSCNARPLRLVGNASVFRTYAEIPNASFWPFQQDGGDNPVIAAIETAVRTALAGEAGAIVTAPIQKSRLLDAGFSFKGH